MSITTDLFNLTTSAQTCVMLTMCYRTRNNKKSMLDRKTRPNNTPSQKNKLLVLLGFVESFTRQQRNSYTQSKY